MPFNFPPLLAAMRLPAITRADKGQPGWNARDWHTATSCAVPLRGES